MVGAKVCGALVRRRGRAVLALLLLGALLGVRVPLSATDSIDFPHHTPAELAHFLADFSNHHRLDETMGSWWVEGEAGNYTWWRYEVRYECGSRCTGRAQLTALSQHGDSGPRHGAAHRHRLHLADTRCRTPPLLPWPAVCDKTELEMTVEPLAGEAGDASGARVARVARGACGVPAALVGGCGLGARLEAQGRALRAALGLK